MAKYPSTVMQSVIGMPGMYAWVGESSSWVDLMPSLLLKSMLSAQVPFIVTENQSHQGWVVLGGNQAAARLLQADASESICLVPDGNSGSRAYACHGLKSSKSYWSKEEQYFLPEFPWVIWSLASSEGAFPLSSEDLLSRAIDQANPLDFGVGLLTDVPTASLHHALVAHSPQVIFVCSPDLQIKEMNSSAERLVGRSVDDLRDHSLIPFVYPDDLFKIEEAFVHVWSAHEPVSFQMRVVTHQQQLRYLICQVVALPDHDLIFLYASDVTDRKIASRMDRDLRVRFEAVYNKAQDAIVLTTPYGHFVQVNPAASKILGFTEEELLQLSLDELMIRHAYTKSASNTEKRLDPGNQRGMVELRRKDQQLVICRFTLSENILPGIHLYILTDVTELEHSRRQIQQQKLRIEATLDSIGDAFFTVDNNWIITYWNRLAEERFKLTRQVACGRKMWDVFQTQPDSEYTPYYLEAMREKHSVYFESYSNRDASWYEVSIYPNDLGLSVYIKDISARKQAEEQLRELNLQLDRKAIALANSNAELERFAYVASHDLQEPLRMVSSFLQLLQRKYRDQIDDVSSKYIDFAVTGAERMKQLINDLLEYSRISLQGYAIEPVDMQEVMQEVVSLMAARIAETKAEVAIGEMPIIQANRIAMQQLMLNLVSNALKYHHKGEKPEVKITCSENLLEWKFTVADNGIGIDNVFQDKIFIIFQRLHNREEYAGTGIGLAICKKIVDHLNGRIWVDSKLGLGSRFHVAIPRKEVP